MTIAQQDQESYFWFSQQQADHYAFINNCGGCYNFQNRKNELIHADIAFINGKEVVYTEMTDHPVNNSKWDDVVLLGKGRRLRTAGVWQTSDCSFNYP